jgi:hypothetical protein
VSGVIERATGAAMAGATGTLVHVRRHGVGRLAVALLVAAPACRPAADAPRLVATLRDGAPAIAFVAPAGARVNARLVPALEFGNGRVVRLANGATDAGADYFTEAPWTSRATLVSGSSEVITVRASVCSAGERLCRTLSFRTRLPAG